MIKCDKVKMFKGRANKEGYINIIVLEELGEVVVTEKQYKNINMGDVVSLSMGESGKYSVINIFKRIIDRDRIKSLESKYEIVNS